MNQYLTIKASSFEIEWAKLYLFLLPYRMFMPFEFLKDILGPLASYVDLIFNLIGLLLWLHHGLGFNIGKENRSTFNLFRNIIFYLNFSSFLMAIYKQIMYGDCNGVSPFKGILAMEIFYFHYIFIMLYNIRVFQILNYEDVVRILKKTCKILLVLGYIQVAVMSGIGGGIYDAVVGVIGGVNPSSQLPKLCLTGSEGAVAGSIMTIFVFPYLLARNIYGDKKAIYELLLWMVPLYFTHSSTAFILFFLNIIVYVIIVLKDFVRNRARLRNLIITSLVVLAGMSVAKYIGLVNVDVLDEVNYLLFEKVSDEENGSTVSRSIPLFINWGAFTEEPVMGVGNGLQGYFYNKYFPTRAFYVEGSDVGNFYEVAQTGIVNGGIFWGGYLSGYGTIGIILAIVFVKNLIRLRKRRSKVMGLFNEFFIIAAPTFFLSGFQGELYATFYAWFIVSLPFMNYSNLDNRYA